jgi:hypothetical protein
MMYNYAEKIQDDFRSITRELIKAKNDPKRYKRLNRSRSDMIQRARRLGVTLRYDA